MASPLFSPGPLLVLAVALPERLPGDSQQASARRLVALSPPSIRLPWAPLGFNLGVGIGRLPLILPAALLARATRNLDVHPPRWPGAVPAHAVGSPGAFWTLGRTAAILGAAP